MINHIWSTDRLSELTSEMRKTLKIHLDKNRGNSPLKRFIYIELSDITAILELINDLSKQYEEAKGKFSKYWHLADPGHRFQKESPYQEELLQTSTSMFLIKSRLIFCMKALHEWLYHLKDKFEKDGIGSAEIGDNPWKNLKACCGIRNNLITHKGKTQDNLVEDVSESLIDGSIELDLVPYAPTIAAGESLEKLLEKLPANLNPEGFTAKKSYYESVELLINEYVNLPGELQGEWHKFIEDHGSISLTSIKIAEFMLEIVNKLIPIFSAQTKQ